MTEDEVIAHWQRGARDELQSAKILAEAGQYSGALFHCHLAVEKALKAEYMREHREDAPLTHDLLRIALQLSIVLTAEEKAFLADLTEFAVAARYDDPAWAEREATLGKVAHWLRKVETFLSPLVS